LHALTFDLENSIGKAELRRTHSWEFARKITQDAENLLLYLELPRHYVSAVGRTRWEEGVDPLAAKVTKMKKHGGLINHGTS
jgi:hypothetical protein